MSFLINVVIGLWCSSIVLGDISEQYCGNGTSITKIILKRNNTEDNYSIGYVIYPRAVLTVAHRVKDFIPEDFQIINFQSSPLNNFVRNVSNIYIHQEYNSCNGSHDFAILTFKDPLPANYAPICLPSENFMNNIRVNYDCSARNHYYSRFYKSSNGSKGKCPMIIFNSDPPEDIEDTNECLLSERGEITDIIGDRSTVVYICRMSLGNKNDYREYYNMHRYYGRLCEKDQSDTYISYYKEDLIYNIRPWIKYIISILIEEDDRPFKLSLFDILMNQV